MQEHIVLFTGITLHLWEEIKRIAEKYDVEAGDSANHVFDARDEYILVWGRDGWRDNFYHACIRWHPAESVVRLTRGTHKHAMPMLTTKKFLDPLLELDPSGEFV